MKLLVAALCITFLASSATCRPIAGRQLLDAASDFINQFRSGANQAQLQTTYNNLVTTNPAAATAALQTTIQNAQQGGNGSVLAGIVANSLTAPGVNTQIAANIVSEATGTPNTGSSGGAALSNVTLNAIAGPGGNVNIVIDSRAAALAYAKDAILKACVKSISDVKGGQTATASADIAATAIGQAAAVAFANITTQITVQGNGQVKSQVDAIAASYANAFAQVIIDVFVQASNDNAKATVSAQLKAFDAVFANAFLAISQKITQDGPGQINALNAALVQDIKRPCAEILVKVLATATTAPPTTG